MLPQIQYSNFVGLRRNKQTARLGEHSISAASLSSALGPIFHSPRSDRCTRKSSPHYGLAPSRRRIGFGGANTAAHCSRSCAMFPGSRLSFATFASATSFRYRGCITIRPSRSRLAARLNSGVSCHEQQDVVVCRKGRCHAFRLASLFGLLPIASFFGRVRGARIWSCQAVRLRIGTAWVAIWSCSKVTAKQAFVRCLSKGSKRAHGYCGSVGLLVSLASNRSREQRSG